MIKESVRKNVCHPIGECTMVHRHIGEISVRVDDLDDRERRLVYASIRLIKDINMRDDTLLVVSCACIMLTMIVFLSACVAMDFKRIEDLARIFFVTVATLLVSFIIGSPFAVYSEKRTRLDILSLNRNMRESDRCREFVRDYCEAHPGFQKIMDRVADVTQPKTV